MTILREWHGRTAPEKVDAAIELFETEIRPLMKATPGFQRASLARRDLGNLVEFILVSFWRDMDALKAFAGPAPEKARVLERTEAVLWDTERFTRLYDVVGEA